MSQKKKGYVVGNGTVTIEQFRKVAGRHGFTVSLQDPGRLPYCCLVDCGRNVGDGEELIVASYEKAGTRGKRRGRHRTKFVLFHAHHRELLKIEERLKILPSPTIFEIAEACDFTLTLNN